MLLDRIIIVCLGVFMLLYGILAVTNIEVLWSRGIMGVAALVLGVVCVIRAVAWYYPPRT